MDQTPGCNRRRAFFRGPLDAGDHALNDAKGDGELGIFRPLGQNRSEHHAEQATLSQCEFDVGQAGPDQRIHLGFGSFHRSGELSEALSGDRGEKLLLAGEMAICCGARHADASRDFAQQDAFGATLVEYLSHCSAHGVW
jgi:hypothetical protein